MEGPTPVSALIHAATMVTAGVYLIGRNAALFSHAPQTLLIVAIIGAATALMAGTIGLVQNDIKRVLAYSTVSQLGYMFLAMGAGAFAAGIFHLYTHAFFKALLFLGAGAVIHALGGEQDLRRMGGLRKDLPIAYWTFLIGSLAIAGVPGFSGFFSKDEILYQTYAAGFKTLWAIGLLTAFLTAVYMFRILFLTFHGDRTPLPAEDPPPHGRGSASLQMPAHPSTRPGSSTSRGSPTGEESAGSPVASGPGGSGGVPPPHGRLHDAPPAMALALIVLAVGSIFAGYVKIGGRFERFLEPAFAPQATAIAGEGDAESLLTWAASGTAVAGILTAAYFFLKPRPGADRLALRFRGLYRVLMNKYYVDEIYDAALVQPVRIVSEEALWKGVDVRVIDGTVNGVGRVVSGSSLLLRRLQTGSVRAYAASLFLGAVLILGYYLWR
jgi:NADH-quinone oxidoreductase subunit L